MCLTRLIKILINEEKYGEALEFSIHNLERIKLRIKDLNEEIKEISYFQNNLEAKQIYQTLPLFIYNKLKNAKDVSYDINLNNQFLIRSYFLLGLCYDKIGENCSTFDDKIKSLKLALSFFKQAYDNIPDNLSFIYYLALEYYNLRLFDQAEDILKIALNSEKKYTFSSSINYFYIYCLNVLVNIANLKFDNAYQLIETVFFNDDVTNFKFYTLNLLKYYIMIYKITNYTEEEKKEEESRMLISEMITFFDSTLKQINDEIEVFKKKYTEINIIKNSSLEEIYFQLSGYYAFDKYDISVIEHKQLEFKKSTICKKKFEYEKKTLDKLRIDFIEKFYWLFDKLISNKFDNKNKIREFCNTFYFSSLAKFKAEDDEISLLLIV